MKKRRNKKIQSWLMPALAVGMFIFVCACVYVATKSSSAEEVVDSVPPELQSAALFESLLQVLPEEGHSAGALKIPIFIYHKVKPYSASDTDTEKSFEVTPQLFEQQLKYLHDNGYTTISLDEVAADLKNGTTSPVAKPVVLTFDDGWENQYTYAFPILKKYHDKATFYIYPRAVGSPNFLTWSEIKDMDTLGMSIEDHSLTHPRFKNLPLAQVKEEVVESKKILEQELGKPVIHFASPFGYSNASIIAVVQAAGYTTYRTTYKGVYQENPLRLRGILVTDSFNYFIKELGQ